MKRALLFFILFGISLPSFAQNLKREITSLEQDFKSFEYKKVLQKGRFLLADTYAAKSDSLLIFQYMLSSAYALNDTTQAKAIILEILKDRPDFVLNPKETSPKIVEFFNIIKKEHTKQFEKTPTTSSVSKKPEVRQTIPAMLVAGSILLPGSAHYFWGNHITGLAYSALSAAIISSAVYFTIKTSADRRDYLAASGNANYNALYDTYNASYKMRTLSYAAWGIWSLYCLYDLQQTNLMQPVIDTQNKALRVQFQYRW